MADAKKGGAKKKDEINSIMTAWLDRYGVHDKDARPELSAEERRRRQSEERRRLMEMKPEARIDLHGHIADDVDGALDSFFDDCLRKGLKKVLIVHGKGIHSNGRPVLSSMVKSYLDRCHFAGESGQAAPNDGGSGATWVILKGPDK